MLILTKGDQYVKIFESPSWSEAQERTNKIKSLEEEKKKSQNLVS